MDEDKFYAIVFSGQIVADYSIEGIFYSKNVGEIKFKKKLAELKERGGWRPNDMLFLLKIPMKLIDEADELLGTGISMKCSKFINNNIDEIYVMRSNLIF